MIKPLFTTKKSKTGKGNFAAIDLPQGQDLGVGIVKINDTGNPDQDMARYDICTYTNHSYDPNVLVSREGNKYRFKTLRDVRKGEELFVDYSTFDFEGERDFVKRSSLKDKYLKKEASVAALQKKQYWQLLKRMYGGTDEAVKAIKETGDTGIWHGSRSNAADNIMREGLVASESVGDKGVFFGPRSLAGVLSKDLVRLKRPSELSPTDLYPNTNTAVAVGKNHAEMWAPASWTQESIARRYNNIHDIAARKFKYFGIDEQGKRAFPSYEVMYKDDVPNKLLKRIENDGYFVESHAIINKPVSPSKDESMMEYFARRFKNERKEFKELNNRYSGKNEVKLSSLQTHYLEKTSALKEDVELYPHQERVIKKILDRDNTIIAHAVGSGKTLTTVAGFEKLKQEGKAKKALVVVPASLRDNYALEGVNKFTDSSYNIVGNQQELRSEPNKYGLPTSDRDYNIVSYELFRRDPERYIKESGADTVIFDELHRGKNITKTYESIKQSRPLYNKFIGGTGSVVSNKLTDVLPLIDAATAGEKDLTRTENLKEFENKFFIRDNSPKYRGVDDRRKPIIGLRNKNELGKFLGEYVDYTGYEDVKDLADMPDKVVHEVKVPVSPEQAKAYKRLLRNDKDLRKLIAQRRYEYLRDDELSRVYNKMIEARKMMNDVGSVRPGDPIHETVEQSPKTKALLDDTASYLEDNPEGRVLLTSFLVRGGTEALEAGLQNRDIEYGKFIGKGNEGITEESRQKAVRDFNAGKLRALVLSSAGGEGLSLGDTTRVNVLDPHFNPERMNQIEARGIRSGGLKHLPKEERKVDVNRYIATMPEKKLLFLKWKDRMQTPDEVIYEIAKKKDNQNKILQDFLHEIT